MSGIEAFLRSSPSDIAKSALGEELSRPRPAISLIGGAGRESGYAYEASLLDHIFYYMGKPEEWTTKLIGNLLSDDPKYDWGSGTVRDQVWSGDLFGDALGPEFPVTSALLGLAAAVSNPLDPLNKLKLFGLTRKGVRANRISQLAKNNTLWKTVDNVKQIDTSDITKRIDELRNTGTPAATRAVKNLERTKDEFTSLNEYIKAAAKDGLSIDDLGLAKARSQNIAEGNMRVLGLSSPLKMDHLSMFGVGKGTFDSASNSLISGGLSPYGIPGVPKISASVVRGFEGVGEFTKKLVESGGRGITNLTGFHFLGGKFRPLARQIDQTIDTIDRDVNEVIYAVRDIVRDAKLTQAEFGEFFNYYRDYLNKFEQLPPHKAKAILEILENEVSEVITSSLPKKPKIQDFRDIQQSYDPHTGRTLVTDAELTPKQVNEAVEQWAQRPINERFVGNRAGYMDGKYVAIGDVGGIDPDIVESLKGVEGAISYATAERQGLKMLVGKRPLGTKYGMDITDPIEGSVIYGPEHHRSMELLTAQLTKRGLVFRENVGLKDFMFTEDGKAFLINPDAVAKHRKIKNAGQPQRSINDAVLASNKATLFDLADRFGYGVDTVNQNSILDSKQAIHSANKWAKELADRRRNLQDYKEGKSVNAITLLREANNTSFHEQLLLGDPNKILQDLYNAPRQESALAFYTANDIDTKYKAIKAALEQGEIPNIPPIKIGVSKDGRLEILKGRNDLVAAILNDVQQVRVSLDEFANRWIDADAPFIHGSTKVRDIFLRSSDDIAVSQIEGMAHPEFKSIAYENNRPIPISDKYKRVEGGKYRPLTVQDISYRNDLRGRVSGSDNVFDRTVELFLNPRLSKAKNPARRRVEAALTTDYRYELNDVFVGDRLAAIDISETALASETPMEFVNAIRNKFSNENVKFSVIGRRPEQIQQAFDKIRALAADHMEVLANKGVFTTRALEDPSLMALYRRGIIEHFDGGTLKVISNTLGDDALAAHIKQVLNNDVAADQISAYDKIQRHSASDIVDSIVDDYVENTRNRISDHLVWRRNEIIPDARIEELRKQGIHIDPKEGDISLGKKFLSGRSATKKADKDVYGHAQYTEAVHAFYYTDSGRLFVDTNQQTAHSPDILVRQIYGESNIPRGEFGFINPEEIRLHYPVTEIDVLTNKTVRRLKDRITEVAQALKRAGYSDTLKMNVVTDIPDEHWSKIIHSDTRLGDVLSTIKKPRRNWIKLPKELDGATIPRRPESARLIYAPRAGEQSFKHGSVVHTWMEKIGNVITDMGVKEAEAGIPTYHRASYIPRVSTPEAERAFKAVQEVARDGSFVKGSKRAVNSAKQFMYGRSLPDLTPLEINEFVKAIRKAGGKIDDADDIWNKVLTTVSEGDKAVLHDVARMFDEAGLDIDTPWFQDNLPWALVRRLEASGQALKRKAILDSIADHGAATVVSKEDITRFRNFKQEYANRTETLSQLDAQIKAQELALDKLRATPGIDASEITKMGEEIQALKVKYGETALELENWKTPLHDTYGPHVVDIINEYDSANSVIYIDSEVAGDLLNKKLIDPSYLGGSLDNGVVATRAGAILNVLPDDAKMYFFPEEMMGVVERYFGALNRTTGLGGKAIRLLDEATNIWKQWTLFPVPSYHIRNFISNGFLAWLGGLLNPQSLKESATLLSRFNKFKLGKIGYADMIEEMKKITLRNANDQSINLMDLYREAVGQGVLTGGQHFNEFHYFNKAPKSIGQIEDIFRQYGVVPSSELVTNFFQDNRLLRATKNFGMTAENFFRLGSFIESWKRGNDFVSAGLDVKKIFYDYRNLSQFERRVLRRVFPFYSWSRFNIPRMIETMFTKPIHHYRVAEFVNGIERQANGGGPVDENDLPQWVRDAYGIVVQKDKDTNTYAVRVLDSFLPMYEAYGFPRGNPIKELLDRAEGMLSPILKVPMEAIFNYSLYQKRPIEYAPGQPSGGFLTGKLGFTRRMRVTDGPLGPLNLIFNDQVLKGYTRPLSVVFDAMDRILDTREYKNRPPRFWGAYMDFILGKAIAIDPERARKEIFGDYNRAMSQYKRLRDYAIESNDPTTADFYQGLINELLLTAPRGIR